MSWSQPLQHNPWPHHATISGASLAITRTAYRSVGRLPRVPLGEDNALVALLSRQDARIRYCPTVHVTTSGRTNGRAPGGVGRPCASGAGIRRHSATGPWSRSAPRSRGPDGEGGCGDCMAQDVLPSIKDGRASLECRRGRSKISSKHPRSALHGASSSAEQDVCARLLRPAELPEQIPIARRSLARLLEAD